MKTWRRNFLLVSGGLEALLFSGCLFGYPSLLIIFQQEKIFSHLCETTSPTEKSQPQSEETMKVTHEQKGGCQGTGCYQSFEDVEPVEMCDEQIVEMTLVYTTAAILFGLVAIFLGLSLEFLGLRISRLLASSMIVSGFVFLANTTRNHWYLLWPALNLLAVGTNLLRFSGFQLAGLWPTYSTTILITYSSAYAISTSFFLVAQFLYEWKFSMQTIFLGYACICLLTYIPTLLIPKEMMVNLERIRYRKAVTERNTTANGFGPNETESEVQREAEIPMQNLQAHSEDPDTNGGDEYIPVYEPSNFTKIYVALKSIISVSGILHMYWHFINFFLILFYSSTFNLWAMKIVANSEHLENNLSSITQLPRISYYIKTLGFVSLIGPLFVPISGFITDLLVARARRLSNAEDNELERIGYTMQAPTYPMFASTTLLILTMICKLFSNEVAMYISFGLIAISRPFVVGTCMAYIRLRFPEEQFNILNGVFTTFISIMCFVQYPITKWLVISEESYLMVHVMLLIMLILSLASPLHMMFRKNMIKYARQRWMDTLRESRA